MLNPRQTGVVNFDKWHQYCFFKALDLATPAVFGFITGRRGMLGGQPYSGDPDELLTFLAALDKPIVTKPYGGGHGHGFDLIVASDPASRTLTLRRGGPVGVGDYLDRVAGDPEGLIFQQHVKQHQGLTAFSATAVNTLRILTTLKDSGDVEFPAVILKMGRGSSLIDNVGAGGLAAHLDLETGALSSGFVWPGKETYETHPDSGARIDGFVVPFWREALALAARAHQNLTSARSLGWDVAITERGPLLIEMNSYVSIPVYQRLGHSVRHGVFRALARENNA
ncbi:sugar-transfer associated ATP-grasp domain-containing protein [Thauera sp. 63]|uniref:sugar-transfer associated ATP-grasp domain-containing protein n=1 Tax=Thauera sp. 63 TaxID=497321 RepID=UPI0022B751FC|nr:sugar-transfer associated ATP-grasp domain-containing protein [Thauera sp. 63]